MLASQVILRIQGLPSHIEDTEAHFEWYWKPLENSERVTYLNFHLKDHSILLREKQKNVRSQEWKQESSKEVSTIIQARGGGSGLDDQSKECGNILGPFVKGQHIGFADRLNMGHEKQKESMEF